MGKMKASLPISDMVADAGRVLKQVESGVHTWAGPASQQVADLACHVLALASEVDALKADKEDYGILREQFKRACERSEEHKALVNDLQYNMKSLSKLVTDGKDDGLTAFQMGRRIMELVDACRGIKRDELHLIRQLWKNQGWKLDERTESTQDV